MIEVCVAGIATVLKPSTAANTTTAFTRLLDSTAFDTPASAIGHGRTDRRGRFCGSAGVDTTKKTSQYLVKKLCMIGSQSVRFNDTVPKTIHGTNSDSPPPTFTSLDALGPSMIKLSVDCISTVLEPSTAASATAAFASLVAGALGTHVTAAYCCSTHPRRCFCGDL